MTISPVSLSLVLPTYNETKNLPLLLERLAVSLAHVNKEVIVVDDNSPDRTWELARQLSTQYPWLKTVRRIHDRGLSSAVLAGFALAEGDYLAVMDADLQHDETVLTQFLEKFQQGADIVVGSRKTDGGSIENWSFTRKLISGVATLLAKIALRHPVSDPMSGFFAVRKEIYLQYKDDINPKGFKILLEFLARAKDARTIEVGYMFKNRLYGESKLSRQVIWDYLNALYDLSLGQYIPVRFIKYGVVGVSGLLVSNCALFACLQWWHMAPSYAVAASIELSVLTNFFLNNSWTFKSTPLKLGWPLLRGLLTFHAICLSGALINQAMALKLASQQGLSLYLANALGYTVAAIWNYTINVGITWKERNRL